MTPTHMTVCFLQDVLCVCITQKLQVVYGYSSYGTTVLLLDTSIFLVGAACEIQVMGYGSKHASQSVSDTPFMHILSYNLETTGSVYGHSAYQTTTLLW